MSHQYPHHMPPEPPMHHQVARPAPEPKNGLGVVALVLGSTGIVFGLIPLAWMPALALAVAAGILVIFAWLRIGRRRATNKVVTSIASGVTAVAMALSLYGMYVFIDAFGQLGEDLDNIGKGKQATAAPAKDKPSDKPSEDEPSGPPTDEPEAYEMGDTVFISADDLDDTEASIKVGGPRVRTTPIDSWSSAPANGQFVIFTVKVKCETGRFDLASDDFYVRTKAGDRYDSEDGNAWEATSKEQISYEEVNAGERKKGPLAFDLPVEHGELVYDPNFEGKPVAVWSF
ncbi:MAG: DUF4352 domain-containing protein [Streptosporangiales bacterium]|nr:DUF4352 domain-containing protein [Streptosporangiales bacterium]